MHVVDRRNWLKKSGLASLGLAISLRSLAAEDGLPRHTGIKQLLNLGSNENPYGMSPLAKQAIRDMIDQGNRYTFNIPQLHSFKQELAEHYGVATNQVLVTAGSGEGLALLARHFSTGNLVTAKPTFGILPATARKIGTTIKEVPLDNQHRHDLNGLLQAIDANTALVYICNPANPSSTTVNSDTLKRFCQEAAKKTAVLVDEAYIDFLDDPTRESMLPLVSEHPNILVIRTFSKIHAMAGMRIGFVIGHPDMMKKIGANYFQSTQFCVSALSQTAAMASLKDEGHRRYSRQMNARAREYATAQISGMGYSVAVSQTNFIYFPLTGYTGDFAAAMMKRDVALRADNTPNGVMARISIGTMEEMQAFIPRMKAELGK